MTSAPDSMAPPADEWSDVPATLGRVLERHALPHTKRWDGWPSRGVGRFVYRTPSWLLHVWENNASDFVPLADAYSVAAIELLKANVDAFNAAHRMGGPQAADKLWKELHGEANAEAAQEVEASAT